MNSLNKTCTVLLPLSLAVMTQTSLVQASDDVYQLDDVIVTATRTAQTADQTLAPVSVVTRQDIEESQATGVYELLDKLPGVQLTSNGGPGSTTSLMIRGTSSQQVLVMIDGQRIGSATNGTASIEYLDPDQIERIEIVRGPRASLYGADAVGGVMNVITRTSSGEPMLSLKTGYGSRNTRTASANVSGNTEVTRYHLGVSRFITDGYDRTTSKKNNNKDDDFYYNTTVTTKVDHDFTDDLTIGVNFYQSEGASAYDGIESTIPEYDTSHTKPRYIFKEQALSTFAKYNVSDDWQTTLTLSHSVDESEASRDADPNKYETKRNSVNWQNDIAVTNATLLTAGLDYYKDKVDSTKNYDEKSRTNKAVFAQTQTAFEYSDLQLALRHDDNQRYGKNTTGNIAWGVNMPADMRLIASYGTAFRAPTFNDLYWPETDGMGGNPNLNPEKSKSSELELRGQHPTGNWSVSIYQTDIDNMISWEKVDDDHLYRPHNIDKARIRGLEASSTAFISDWKITGTLTLLDTENRSHGSNKGNDLPYRARKSASLDAYKRINDFGFGGTIRAQGRSDTNDGNTDSVAGFATIDLRGEWHATKELKAGLKVVNALDKKHSTRKDYIEEPRGVFATLTWTPEI